LFSWFFFFALFLFYWLIDCCKVGALKCLGHTCSSFCLLIWRWSFWKYLFRIASNHELPDLRLSSS
jgi:hypothetical protein